jgi:hypothetical protein
MFCGQCGTDLPIGAKFCTSCGTPVEEASVSPPSAQSAAPPPVPAPEFQSAAVEETAVKTPAANATVSPPQKKRKSKAKIALFAALGALLALAGAAAYFAFMLSASPLEDIRTIPPEEYLADPSRYESGDGLTLTLEADFLNSLVFSALAEKDLPVTVKSLRLDVSRETLEVSAQYGLLGVGLNMSAEPELRVEDGELLFSLRCRSLTFGRGDMKLGVLAGGISANAFDVETALPGLGAQLSAADANYQSRRTVLTLTVAEDSFRQTLLGLEPYRDETYAAIFPDESVPYAGFTREWLSAVLLPYTPQGVERLFEAFPLAAIVAGEDFGAALEAVKRQELTAYAANVRAYAYDLLRAYSELYAYEDVIGLNAKLYRGFDPGATVTVWDITAYATPPEGFSPAAMMLLYDADRHAPGISYPSIDGGMTVVALDGSEQTLTQEEYQRLFITDPAPKGAIRAPMPRETDRLPIQDAIKTYMALGEDALLYVRYLRCDDKYAVAVISPVSDKQTIRQFCLERTGGETWRVIAQIYSSDDYRSVYQNPAYRDFNLGLVPTVGLDGYYQPYLDTESLRESLAYEEAYGYAPAFPRLASGTLAPIEIATRIDDYIYLRFVTDVGESYLIDINGYDAAQRYTRLSGYPHLLELLTQLNLPLFLGLQV